jgi:hypothetical protein
MRSALVLSLMAIGAGSCAALPSLDATVTAFEARAENCAHWSGEDAYDPTRGAQIGKMLKVNRCNTLLADAERLRAANASNPGFVARIDAAVSPF